jgi:LmbE family N-acetylglucosaminyl deacetylase
MRKNNTAAVIVAHPDDETIWAGGTVLMNNNWKWIFVSLCRSSDPVRSARFTEAVHHLGGVGWIGDLDDGPEQIPIDEVKVQKMILSLLPNIDYDLVLTHSPRGEYTRHRRHEECSKAVSKLWEDGLIRTKELWMFAYSDTGRGGKDDIPQIIKSAHKKVKLTRSIWERKQDIITNVYGFTTESYEARTASKEEAFWSFYSPADFQEWLKTEGGWP